MTRRDGIRLRTAGRVPGILAAEAPIHTLVLLAACAAPSGLVPPADFALRVDADGDGYVAPPEGNDCDDADPAVHPTAPDLTCDGVDNDCYHQDGPDDADGDGVTACGGDCDDADPERAPGLAERCNRLDEDCDGAADEDFDLDHDGHAACGPLLAPVPQRVVVPGTVGGPLLPVDFDGDGRDELLATVAVGPGGLAQAGVLSSSPDCPLCAVARVGSEDRQVYAFHPLGDADGDGVDDVLLSEQTPAGWVRGALLWGGVAPVAALSARWDRFYRQSVIDVLPFGDVDADGRPDLLVVPQALDGAARALWWATAEGGQLTLRDAAWLTDADVPLPDLYRAVAADVDGDGALDAVLFGLPGFSAQPLLMVLPGSPRGPDPSRAVALTPDPSWTYLVDPVVVGDVNGDGRADLAVQVVTARDGVEAFGTQILLGAAEGLELGAWLPGDAPLPGRVRALGDLDGDGRAEIAELSCPLTKVDPGADGAGYVHTVRVWSGEPLAVAQEILVGRGTIQSGEVGVADLDGDGLVELIVVDSTPAGFGLARGALLVYAQSGDCDDQDPAVWRGCP